MHVCVYVYIYIHTHIYINICIKYANRVQRCGFEQRTKNSHLSLLTLAGTLLCILYSSPLHTLGMVFISAVSLPLMLLWVPAGHPTPYTVPRPGRDVG